MADSSGYMDSSGLPDTRVTEIDVRRVMDLPDDYDDRKIEAFIYGANALINEHLEGKGLSTKIMFEIERWLTAHMMSVSVERMAKKEGAGGASIEYTGNFDAQGLDSTPYGQMVISLDSTNTMKSLNQKSAFVRSINQF